VLLGGDSALQLIDGAPDELRNSAEMLRAAIMRGTVKAMKKKNWSTPGISLISARWE
jgi:hypothetical protein